MDDDRMVKDLNISPGQRVVFHGHQERAEQSPHRVVWVLNPWDPDHEQRYADGSITVIPRHADRAPVDELVRVAGVWNGVSVEDAIIEPATDPRVARIEDSDTKAAPRQVGETVFLASLESVSSAGAPVLASGGSMTHALVYLLYMTPSAYDAQKQSPVRLDIFVAITPLLG